MTKSDSVRSLVREAVEVKMPLAKIKPAAYNPRRKLEPGDKEYESIKRSITEFGLVDPLIVNKKTGNLVGGHQRLTVLLDMGVKEARVRLVDLSPAREKVLNVALNKITGEWNDLALANLLEEIGKDGDLTLTGFDEMEHKGLLESIKDEAPSGFKEVDENIETKYKCPKCGFTGSGNWENDESA